MKTIMNKISLALAVTMTFSLPSCSDFLDKEPLSQGTEAITFKTPEQFEQAANALYVLPGWNNYKDRLEVQISRVWEATVADQHLTVMEVGDSATSVLVASSWKRQNNLVIKKP